MSPTLQKGLIALSPLSPSGSLWTFCYSCSMNCGLQLLLNAAGGIQSAAIWDAAGFPRYLHGAGRNCTGAGTADHYPAEDIKGRQERYLWHLK